MDYDENNYGENKNNKIKTILFFVLLFIAILLFILILIRI